MSEPARTTRWTRADIGDLSGRVAVITGANSGLGLQISTELAGAGARVLMACRNRDKANAAIAEVLARRPKGTVEFLELDLADLGSVARAATELASRTDRLDILGNNAGLMATDRSHTVDGFEMQFGVNHLGHFALTGQVLELLLATPGSRVVNHSSMGHRPGRMNLDDPNSEHRRYHPWRSYFQSKLANLLFTFELQRRLAATGADVIAVAAHPGGTRTDLGAEGSGWLNRLALAASPLWGQHVSVGALPFVQAATDPTARGGDFYGPSWLVRGRPRLETPTRRARDEQTARRLWTLSEDLTGVRYLD
ncbi:MAG: SDR family NAD(P)-dependent oxidoreductase [Acidimicrobiia bacterium]|nr:SDR family NAD(P)-dependent oxidoreductase [Acidimicrobiia bacterium]